MTRARSDGFSLVSAIFLLVVVSTAAAAMIGLVGTEQRSASLGALGTRALYAARSGVEWAAVHAVAAPALCPTGAITLGEGALAGFTVTVGCTRSEHDENGARFTTFRLSATATRGSFGSADFVSRRVESTLTVAGP